MSKKNKLILCSRNISSVKKNFFTKYPIILKFDANNLRDVKKLFYLTKSKLGKIDGIICCQGFLGEPEYIYDYNIKKWSNIFDLNFKSNLIIVRKVLKLIKKKPIFKDNFLCWWWSSLTHGKSFLHTQLLKQL